MLIEFIISVLNFYLKDILIDFGELGIFFITFNFLAVFVIIQIHIFEFGFECMSYMFILMSIVLGYGYIKTLNIEFLKFCILSLGLSILFRFLLWKYYLEEHVYKNPKRRIKIDFSVLLNSEEIFYRRITFQANNKSSDLLNFFKKNFLSEMENNKEKSYKFYINDKLMYNIDGSGNIEYCQNFDFELGSFPMEKILCSKVEIINNNL